MCGLTSFSGHLHVSKPQVEKTTTAHLATYSHLPEFQNEMKDKINKMHQNIMCNSRLKLKKVMIWFICYQEKYKERKTFH